MAGAGMVVRRGVVEPARMAALAKVARTGARGARPAGLAGPIAFARAWIRVAARYPGAEQCAGGDADAGRLVPAGDPAAACGFKRVSGRTGGADPRARAGTPAPPGSFRQPFP